ncbi:FadR/GntR family transcriptional regulator [Streptomyces scabiei]|uniref:HTH-type transcriptional repressor YvoA n=1 Tax=Streptomyces scabiei TaxID=1930 RepID=A0A100JY08_STRSC|nr:GntR family transcriptional regulator [Streptomyces scabiei]GAQ67771.1 HTH-type transcriptional repressor YvoA [Streptomyces scabiei]
MVANKEVIEQIEGLITNGEWPPEHRIPSEPELVQHLGVGRNTVREAVTALVHTGMLQARQGVGTLRSRSGVGAALARVVQHRGVLEVYEMRASPERDAARTAAVRATADDLARASRGRRCRATSRASRPQVLVLNTSHRCPGSSGYARDASDRHVLAWPPPLSADGLRAPTPHRPFGTGPWRHSPTVRAFGGGVDGLGHRNIPQNRRRNGEGHPRAR